MISQAKLDFWISNNYNVLFIGKKGCGKSSLVIDAFNRAGLKWKYFSAATMDPWVDFIGVPKEKEDETGTYLDLIKPKEFRDDQVEAIFFDEFNRAHKKVRNSVMELIQFKSINGNPYNNLRIVWAAINPEDDDSEKYDVEPLDPAQKDRFHIHVEIPYQPYHPYFREKFGGAAATIAINWWKELPDKVKDLVSPRRLDYALNVYFNHGDVRDVLPLASNPSKLIISLKDQPINDKLRDLFMSKNSEETKKFLADENNYASAINIILKDKPFSKFFIPLLSDEKISSLLIDDNNQSRDTIVSLAHVNKNISNIIKSIIDANQNIPLIEQLKTMYVNINDFINTATPEQISGTTDQLMIPNENNSDNTTYANLLVYIQSNKLKNAVNTYHREAIFNDLVRLCPNNLSYENALRVYSILNSILERSQVATIQKWEKSAYLGVGKNSVTRLVNTIIKAIHDGSGSISFAEMWAKYDWGNDYLFDKLIKSGLSNDIYRPAAKKDIVPTELTTNA